MHVANSSVRANDVSDQVWTIWTARKASLSDERSVGPDLFPARGITKSGHGMDGHKHRNWRGLASAPRPSIYQAQEEKTKDALAGKTWSAGPRDPGSPCVSVTLYRRGILMRHVDVAQRLSGWTRRTCGTLLSGLQTEFTCHVRVYMGLTYIRKYCIEYGQRTI